MQSEPEGLEARIIQELRRLLAIAEIEKARLLAERDEAREALLAIDTWAKAYPLSVFPEPDFVLAAKLLKAGGLTLDAVSASNMRHVLTGIQGLVSEALKDAP